MASTYAATCRGSPRPPRPRPDRCRRAAPRTAEELDTLRGAGVERRARSAASMGPSSTIAVHRPAGASRSCCDASDQLPADVTAARLATSRQAVLLAIRRRRTGRRVVRAPSQPAGVRRARLAGSPASSLQPGQHVRARRLDCIADLSTAPTCVVVSRRGHGRWRVRPSASCCMMVSSSSLPTPGTSAASAGPREPRRSDGALSAATAPGATTLDATGAGDIFMAAYTAARLCAPQLTGTAGEWRRGGQ